MGRMVLKGGNIKTKLVIISENSKQSIQVRWCKERFLSPMRWDFRLGLLFV